MHWQALIDFDGTITLKDTTDEILERFADPLWRDVEDDWLAGRIGSRQCMERQVALLRATPTELDDFIAKVEIDWGFKSFVRSCQRRNIRLVVASDGFDRVITAVLGRAGLAFLPVVANHLAPVGHDRWQMTSPFAAGDCASGTCKCAVAGSFQRPMTLLVGDGKSDHCVAGEADFTFAKAGLVRHCRDNNLPHRPFTSFAQAVDLLEELVDDRAHAGAALEHAREMIRG